MSGILPTNLFGPLSRDYCLYFYLLSAIGLFFFVVSIIGILYVGFSKEKGSTFISPP